MTQAADGGPSRRERTHAATVTEIKDVSRRLMAEQGTASLNLRPVARAMGMTPSALYRYFDSRDALLTALIVDAYDDVGSVAEQTAASLPPGIGSLAAVMTIAHAFRDWAVAQPHAYGLLFGAPVPGYEMPEDQVLSHKLRVSGVLLDLMRAGLAGGLQLPLTDDELEPGLRHAMQLVCDAEFTDLAPAAAATALACWSTLLGALSVEIFGHLPPEAVPARRELFALTMRRQLIALGLPADT